ncbi:MAG: DUF4153 domain-containing protein [Saprospiraceae bacterium]
MKKAFFIFLFAMVFHVLTWEAEMGLNMALFAWLMTAAVGWWKRDLWERQEVRWVLGAWCYAGLMVVIHHSTLSMVVYWLLALVSVGYMQPERVRFWVFGGVESVVGLATGWLSGIRHLTKNSGEFSNRRRVWGTVLLWVVPLLVAIPFYLLYSEANIHLSTLNARFERWWAEWVDFDVNIARFIVFLLCWVLVLAFLATRKGITALHHWAAGWSFRLLRERSQDLLGIKGGSLRQEYRVALATFWTLNLLLGGINILDIMYVWLGSSPLGASELSQYVHEGTWLLFFSILLAMLVVLYFFRGNLNFHPHRKRLVQVAYVWLAQNAFLALSVGMRNGRYIQHYDLAHGRVVVLFFLLLVLFGLYTMYRKVRKPGTLFYWVQTNGVAVLVALLLAASVNWDALITRYNLRSPQPDTYYLTDILTNNLTPLIQHVMFSPAPVISVEELQSKIAQVENAAQYNDWRSWNLSEYRQLRYIQQLTQQ